ncbi:hypothetical protein FPCIR_5605 [Fusarium pseudocircinatum]|uniref:2EXR domain-containing protein n=1 Tax=Fusarium pseudocircinatum TaxID=56676 RepID=A0A8H5UM02_9HYPO|nr:hypothetical protein FPCIR_5605 [Fusarium pseudocircinatum]
MGELTFPLFSQFPLELREQIWKMAIRPDKPGVQIFRVYHPELDNPGHAVDIHGFTLERNFRRVLQGYPVRRSRIALPVRNKYPDSTDGSSDDDISTYLIDSSLWTVCQESRSMMKKVFGSTDASSQSLSGSATAHYLSGSVPSYITIYPKNDLIVLQFDDVLKFDNSYLLGLFQKNIWGSVGVLNLGIEYNIDWGISEHGKRALRKLCYLASITLFVNVWIIDHNLKRREGAPPQKDSVKHEYKNPELNTAFYANDKKVLKVNLELRDGFMDHWKYLKVVSEDCDDSSIDFVNRLREKVWLHINPYCNRPCYVGLLGWDDVRE